MRIGVIGGGFMGLALAHRMTGAGHQVSVFEREDQLGGLATYHDFGSFYWDRFYHVILPTDDDLLSFLDTIGLTDKLRWKQTYTGYYVDRRFYSVSNTKEFLLFPPLGLIAKARLALTILLGARIKDWRKMEKRTIEDWLTSIGGRGTFDKFWKPLLLAKLGENYKRVSAVFIWTYIKRLFGARDTSSKKEQMGYVAGGYKTVFDHLEGLLRDSGAEIQTQTTVTSIAAAPEGGLYVTANGQRNHFDKVVFTGPVGIMERLISPDLIEIKGDSRAVEYLGVVCLVLATRKGFTPYYVLNLADERLPFTGVIGMSTLVSPEETGGYHLTYFPKYVLSTDPILRKPDEELKALFLQGVRTLYPELRDEDIVSVHVNRAFQVQPLLVLDYSQIAPKARTLHPDLYILNTSQFMNDTLNNNSVARHVSRFWEEVRGELAAPQPRQDVRA